MGFYWKKPWTDDELSEQIVSLYKNKGRMNLNREKIEDILNNLGRIGMAKLNELKKIEEDTNNLL